MSKSIIGEVVTIKKNIDSWAAGESGIVMAFDGEYYHIAITGDTKTQLVFERSEFTLPRKGVAR